MDPPHDLKLLRAQGLQTARQTQLAEHFCAQLLLARLGALERLPIFLALQYPADQLNCQADGNKDAPPWDHWPQTGVAPAQAPKLGDEPHQLDVQRFE